MTGTGLRDSLTAPASPPRRRTAPAAPLLLAILPWLLATGVAQAVSPPVSPPAPPLLAAPASLLALDHPSDTGGAIRVTWKDPASLPQGTMLVIRRAEAPADEWTEVARVAPGVGSYKDSGTDDARVYRYEVRAVLAAADSAGAEVYGIAAVSDPASSHDNWFHTGRVNSFIACVVFAAIILFSIGWARSGREIFIRRIAGLNAIDEAIGRATEIGKKVLYIPGIQSMDNIQTIASIAILGHVARSTARYGTDLDVPNKDPITFASAREAVHGAYLAEGRPDLFREEMVNYVTYDQFAFTAAVSARMVREKPAAIFLVGYFFAESLILAETGQSTGAIQIAGQADPTQLPFFVATCDYTLIGEELYAASAYLSREPVLLGSTRGQDIAKGILLLIGIAGVILASFGQHWLVDLLRTE